ncbi:MAG: ATP-binding cassette domain-containing protein [Deltaproteobacteria bacterium]|nr:ATP-binding cassette domain-containing protein [Deltaproteobacteria bacterium]
MKSLPGGKKVILAAVGLVILLFLGYRLLLYRPSVPVITVKQTEVKGQVKGPGTVQSKVPVAVSTKITDIVEKLYADQGDRVRKDQLLAELDAAELKARAASSRAARRLRREKIGFVFQSANLIPFLTARENVLFPLNLVGLNREAAEHRVAELLEYMEISERAHYLPALLSGGEQQRVAIARALANRPKLILADEPTASLDTVRGKKVMEMLKKIARENQTA